MTWPTKLDPKDVQSGSALKTLTMREFLGCKLVSRGDYEWHKGRRAEAQVSYALAHQLYPACRSIFEILASQMVEESQRYPWSPVFRMAAPGKGKTGIRSANAVESPDKGFAPSHYLNSGVRKNARPVLTVHAA